MSRETGHKWLRRFREQGYDGLEEAKSPFATAEEIVFGVLEAREAHPNWGPKKLVDLLHRRFGKETPSQGQPEICLIDGTRQAMPARKASTRSPSRCATGSTTRSRDQRAFKVTVAEGQLFLENWDPE